LIEEEVDDLPPGYDLYVDATGFKRKFVKDFTRMKISDYHFVDQAWVCPMEKSPNDADVTKSIARKYGWSFEVNLQNRVGMGYIHSSKHVSKEDALQEFREIYTDLGRKPLLKHERFIKWDPMILQNPWSDNVVAIGTASGFVDPLEATALFMTSLQSLLAERAPQNQRGMLLGTLQSSTSLARFMGGAISGLIYAGWGLDAPFLLAALAMAPALVLAWQLRGQILALPVRS
ncbi:MAG: MFS transporter, partial [Alphaproteobacteria bacterium]|nr:MFS transporter [Alphaproteobacteria bacterium]